MKIDGTCGMTFRGWFRSGDKVKLQDGREGIIFKNRNNGMYDVDVFINGELRDTVRCLYADEMEAI
jgi:hypothetical protein